MSEEIGEFVLALPSQLGPREDFEVDADAFYEQGYIHSFWCKLERFLRMTISPQLNASSYVSMKMQLMKLSKELG